MRSSSFVILLWLAACTGGGAPSGQGASATPNDEAPSREDNGDGGAPGVAMSSLSAPEICDNGLDDDGNGHADDGCAAAPDASPPETDAAKDGGADAADSAPNECTYSQVTSIAGDVAFLGTNYEDGTGTVARFGYAIGLKTDPTNGDIIVQDDNRVRRVTTAGVTTTLATLVQPKYLGGYVVTGVASDGTVYSLATDTDSGGPVLLKFPKSGAASTITIPNVATPTLKDVQSFTVGADGAGYVAYSDGSVDPKLGRFPLDGSGEIKELTSLPTSVVTDMSPSQGGIYLAGVNTGTVLRYTAAKGVETVNVRPGFGGISVDKQEHVATLGGGGGILVTDKNGARLASAGISYFYGLTFGIDGALFTVKREYTEHPDKSVGWSSEILRVAGCTLP